MRLVSILTITIVTNKMTNVTIISTVPASPDTSLEKVTIGVKNGIYELTIANVLFGSNNDLRLIKMPPYLTL